MQNGIVCACCWAPMFCQKTYRANLTMKENEMKTHVVMLLSALLLVAGCATTPDAVRLVTEMQSQTIAVVQDNTFNILEAYNEEAKALSANRYAAEFASAEAALTGTDGKVDIAKYKAVALDFANELDKSNDYYDEQLLKFKTKLAYQFMVAGRLNDAIKLYQNAKTVTPETANELVDAIASLAAESISASQAANEIESDDTANSWSNLLDIIRGRIITGIETYTLNENSGG